MNVMLLAGYFYPETVGAGVWLYQLARDLRDAGHDVTVVTGLPNYPAGRVFPEYRGRWYVREEMEGIRVVRTFTYATPSKRFWPRVAAFGSFCISCLAAGFARVPRPDVLYAVLPPLPLGVSAAVLARHFGAPLVVNVQDLYPDAAVALGALRNRAAIRLFQRMEKWIYRQAARVVVISSGFAQNLARKGVPRDKLAVVPNWADPGAIAPRPRETGFRRGLAAHDETLVLYCGGITHNSNLEPLLAAACLLRSEPFVFVIAGEGARKRDLETTAVRCRLENVRFLPFQSAGNYAEALASADVTVATLHPSASFASVPSKVYKQMSAGRPVLAIANTDSELARLIEESGGGMCISPEQIHELADAVRAVRRQPERFKEMGLRGRSYIETTCNRARCTKEIEAVLRTTAAHARTRIVESASREQSLWSPNQ